MNGIDGTLATGARAVSVPGLASRSGATVDIGLIRSRAEIDAIAPDWEALQAEVGGSVVFQSLGWCRAVFDFETGRANAAFEPVIVTLRKRGVLRALFAFQRVHTRTRRVLVPLGDTFQQYADFLCAEEVDPREAMRKIVWAALSAMPSDVVSLLKVRADSKLEAGMPGNAIKTATSEGAPFVTLSAWTGFEDYFQSIKPKTRKNMRNARNRLEREGVLEHLVAATPAEKLGIISRTLAGRAERLKDQGLTSRAFATTDFADFCTSLAARPDNDLGLLAMSLRHNGEPIAEQWGFVSGGHYYAYVASRDFGQSEESPGKLHLKEVIETCFARGLSTADLLVPVMPYKLTWAKDVMTVTDYAVPVTPKGFVVIAIWDRLLRPMAKRVVLGMPKGPRALVMRVMGRG
ncbi:MAG TPA: GNAT family N-acetyltransferase [Arsenicitalea sp.]|nr:GNAT family N-acetyltransferase [Arsenicitalea sp.]